MGVRFTIDSWLHINNLVTSLQSINESRKTALPSYLFIKTTLPSSTQLRALGIRVYEVVVYPKVLKDFKNYSMSDTSPMRLGQLIDIIDKCALFIFKELETISTFHHNTSSDENYLLLKSVLTLQTTFIQELKKLKSVVEEKRRRSSFRETLSAIDNMRHAEEFMAKRIIKRLAQWVYLVYCRIFRRSAYHQVLLSQSIKQPASWSGGNCAAIDAVINKFASMQHIISPQLARCIKSKMEDMLGTPYTEGNYRKWLKKNHPDRGGSTDSRAIGLLVELRKEYKHFSNPQDMQGSST